MDAQDRPLEMYIPSTPSIPPNPLNNSLSMPFNQLLITLITRITVQLLIIPIT